MYMYKLHNDQFENRCTPLGKFQINMRPKREFSEKFFTINSQTSQFKGTTSSQSTGRGIVVLDK